MKRRTSNTELSCVGRDDVRTYCGKALDAVPYVRLNDDFFASAVCGICAAAALRESAFRPDSIPMRLHCPECHRLHVDEGVWATQVHHTHSCQHCGMTWRPAVVATVGVQFLPGFKND